jgi:hypothetical protein
MGIEDDEIEKIAKEQKKLLYQSLLNSNPAKPEFLEKYDIELAATANHLREKYKTPIYEDKMKDGTETFSASIDATLKKEE